MRFICICRLLYRTAGAANNQNVHEHNKRATTGAVECARLLALLGGFCGFRLLRATELSGGESAGRSRMMWGGVEGALQRRVGKENALSSHGSYAPYEVFVMVCQLWAQAQTIRTYNMLAIIILYKLGTPYGQQRTLTSRYFGSNFFWAVSLS